VVVEPTLLQHIADWVGAAGGTVTAVGIFCWAWRIDKRVGVLELKVDQNRAERELEIGHLSETLQQVLQTVKENAAELRLVHHRQIVVLTKLGVTNLEDIAFDPHRAAREGGETI
jgi:hypothetical protein